jgi:hypothetical protein
MPDEKPQSQPGPRRFTADGKLIETGANVRVGEAIYEDAQRRAAEDNRKEELRASRG